MRLTLGIYDKPGSSGTLIADWTRNITALAWTTNARGYADLKASISLPLTAAFELYARYQVMYVRVVGAAVLAWEGRLEDPVFVTGDQHGFKFTALGYQSALGDLPYTAVWSDTSYDRWRTLTGADNGGFKPAPYGFDTTNQLSIYPTSGESFDNSFSGAFGYEPPDPTPAASQLVTMSFDWTVLAPSATWVAGVNTNSYDPATGIWSTAASPWSQAGSGSGSQSLTFTAADRLVMYFEYNSGTTATFTGGTGSCYFNITNVRVKSVTASTVTADAIVKALVAFTTATNPTQLSSATSGIQAPGIDLTNEVYEDKFPSAILDYLVGLGDNQTPAREWEWAVWDSQQLFFRPKGIAGQTWYVNEAQIEVQRSLSTFADSTYATYTNTNNRTVRTAIGSSATTLAQYGLTRRLAVNAQTTSVTEATALRDATLTDRTTPQPRATITFRKVYNAAGAEVPLWYVRAHDTIKIRNLPTTTAAGIDRVTTMLLNRTEYNAVTNQLTVEPELPRPTVDALLARGKLGG